MNINERVDQISATVQELREAAADGRRARQVLDSLFRTVHSFKAAALAEGLTDLSRTAHDFENVLHDLRTGKITLDAEVLRVFEETVVALRDGSETSSTDRSTQLTNRTPALNDELPAELGALKEEERHRALAARREGANLYVMNIEFAVSDFDERFRQVKQQLERDTELISTSATMHDDQIAFQIVYAANCEKIPLDSVFHQAIRAGHAAATTLNKRVDFVVVSDELLLDKSLSDVLADALLHLVRNAVDHGIESSGRVLLEAISDGEQLNITVTDDGRGIAPENLPHIFQPGFSTAQQATALSGRGVGLDAVKTAVEELGGSVSVTSEPGKGSSFKIDLPI